MLLKTKISEHQISLDPLLNEKYHQARLGKFTASKISCCMGATKVPEGGITYIRTRIGEELTGVSSEKEVSTEEMQWGLTYERDALTNFGKLKNLDYLLVQRLVFEEGSKFGCTPDGLWVKSESTDKLSYEVSTIEVKCYQVGNHIKCALCSTPAEIKEKDSSAYWQTIMQMDECGALIGYLCYFHPLMKSGGFRVIEFRKINLVADFKLLNERKIEILKKYEAEKEILLNITNQ